MENLGNYVSATLTHGARIFNTHEYAYRDYIHRKDGDEYSGVFRVVSTNHNNTRGATVNGINVRGNMFDPQGRPQQLKEIARMVKVKNKNIELPSYRTIEVVLEIEGKEETYTCAVGTYDGKEEDDDIFFWFRNWEEIFSTQEDFVVKNIVLDPNDETLLWSNGFDSFSEDMFTNNEYTRGFHVAKNCLYTNIGRDGIKLYESEFPDAIIRNAKLFTSIMHEGMARGYAEEDIYPQLSESILQSESVLKYRDSDKSDVWSEAVSVSSLPLFEPEVPTLKHRKEDPVSVHSEERVKI